jgi:hypothetical protein
MARKRKSPVFNVSSGETLAGEEGTEQMPRSLPRGRLPRPHKGRKGHGGHRGHRGHGGRKKGAGVGKAPKMGKGAASGFAKGLKAAAHVKGPKAPPVPHGHGGGHVAKVRTPKFHQQHFAKAPAARAPAPAKSTESKAREKRLANQEL